ncbi:hypothetical protein AMECASPLE_001949 [Ameca splendens]|uniref:Uncharacterized protein n=1 Tax=Ameca splendens TaxID=208324 RepID=A0ABV0Z7B4_9TELE
MILHSLGDGNLNNKSEEDMEKQAIDKDEAIASQSVVDGEGGCDKEEQPPSKKQERGRREGGIEGGGEEEEDEKDKKRGTVRRTDGGEACKSSGEEEEEEKQSVLTVHAMRAMCSASASHRAHQRKGSAEWRWQPPVLMGDHFCNGFSKTATEHPCDSQQFPRKMASAEVCCLLFVLHGSLVTVSCSVGSVDPV